MRTFEAGELIFKDKILTNVARSCSPLAHIVSDVGMEWALTLKILSERPEFGSTMLDVLKFRQTNIRTLDQQARQVVSYIQHSLKISEETVLTVYNLVCTYCLGAEIVIEGPIRIPDLLCFVALGFSYINHSCSPNGELESISDHESLFSVKLVAKQRILKGSEITWSYIGNCQHRGLKDRQKKLKRKFGFDCNCYRCFQERNERK